MAITSLAKLSSTKLGSTKLDEKSLRNLRLIAAATDKTHVEVMERLLAQEIRRLGIIVREEA